MEAHPEVSFSEATVSAAEVHMLLLGVRMNWDEHDPFYFAGPLIDSPDTTARNEAAEALREDPGHPLATYLAGGLRKKPSPEQMRKTTVTHPSDWRAFYLLASALDADTQRGAREAALREALRLNPDSAAANNAFAWSLVARAGEGGAALCPAGIRAGARQRADCRYARCRCVRAASMSEAIAVEKRAVALLAQGEGDSMRKRLKDYQQRCATAAAAHPTTR